MNSYIKIKNLTKKFGSKTIINNIDLKINKGDVLGLVGVNGAGKTTTLRMITGFIIPTDGIITIMNKEVSPQNIDYKKHIGYLPEGSPLYTDLSPKAFLNFIATARGLKGDKKAERIEFVIQSLQLESVLDQAIDTLSKGFKRRVGLAQAILHDPDILILDEPTDGLDPVQKREVRNLIKKIAKDKAIIISTHIMEEVSAICTRLVILKNGKVAVDKNPKEIFTIQKDEDIDKQFIEMIKPE